MSGCGCGCAGKKKACLPKRKVRKNPAWYGRTTGSWHATGEDDVMEMIQGAAGHGHTLPLEVVMELMSFAQKYPHNLVKLIEPDHGYGGRIRIASTEDMRERDRAALKRAGFEFHRSGASTYEYVYPIRS